MDEKTAIEILGLKIFPIMVEMYREAKKKYGKIKKCFNPNGTEFENWRECFAYDELDEGEIVMAFYFNTELGDNSTHATVRRIKIERQTESS